MNLILSSFILSQYFICINIQKDMPYEKVQSIK